MSQSTYEKNTCVASRHIGMSLFPHAVSKSCFCLFCCTCFFFFTYLPICSNYMISLGQNMKDPSIRHSEKT